VAGEYVDVEQLLIGWLADVTDLRVAAELPVSITDPTVQVTAVGGSETSPATDRATVDVDVFVPPDSDGEPDLETAQDLAQWIRVLILRDLPGYTATIGPSRATVIRTAGLSRPVRRPFDESGLRRIQASYTLLVASRG
jgi:hypothetical protein